MHVVFDTNVVISRYLSSKGPSAQVFDFWQKKIFDLLVSAPILEEYERALKCPHVRARHQMSDTEIAEIIEEIADLAKMVRPTKRLTVITADPDDDKFLECAVEGKATYIISGNKHLYDLKDYKGVQIFTPAQFCMVLEQEKYKKAA
jgi:putative PIN family toxin of toxin-antitoxin system